MTSSTDKDKYLSSSIDNKMFAQAQMTANSISKHLLMMYGGSIIHIQQKKLTQSL